MEDAVNSTPIEQCRGIETIDLNDSLVLVRAPIEQVAQALNQLKQVVVWERDVYEREVEIQGYGLIVFQFQRHPWTLMRELPILSYSVLLEDKDAQSLSHLLYTKAIFYLVSDTSLSIGYHLYNCGESVEKLFFTSELEDELDLGKEDEEEEDVQGTYQFYSRIRPIRSGDIKDPYEFTEEFFQAQDAYIPAFLSKVIFRSGQRITLAFKDFKRDDFIRMDYILINRNIT